MRFKLTLTMAIAMLVAVLVAIVAINGIQAGSDMKSLKNQEQEKIELIKQTLTSNDAEITRLKDNVSANCLAKARALAELLDLDPSKMNSDAWLQQICKDLDVSEVHIIDSKGIITHSTVSAYIGFDMYSGEQSAAFMEILKDTSLEIAQEPQVNSAAGIVVQYAGVARRDAAGVIQIGIQPQVLMEALEGTELKNVLPGIEVGETGFAFAIDKTTDEILYFKDASLIGKSAKEVGFPADYKISERTVINGNDYFGLSDEFEDYIIGVLVPGTEVYQNSTSSVKSLAVALIVINLLLLSTINVYASLAIVNPIKRICKGVQSISDNDYNVEFKEKNNKEFIQLSAGLNKMTQSIKVSTEQMTEASQALSDATQSALGGMSEIQIAVKDIATNANKQAGDMSVAVNNVALIGDRIANTSQLATNLGNQADVMINDSEVAKDAMNNLKEITENVVKAVEDISVFASNTSVSAQNIFDAASMIDSVAKQTRLLSFNASIEAARAGDAGKGFGVVAEEIQRLADQTGKASASITAIIEDLMSESGQLVESMDQMKGIMEQQKSNLGNADETVGKMIDGVDVTMNGIKEIEQLTAEINNAKDSLREIIESLTSIAQSNAASTEQTDAQLTDTMDVFAGMQVYADKLKEVAAR